MNTYLLTGGTGVLGSAVLRELYSRPDCRIFLLMRSRNPGGAIERTNALLDEIRIHSSDRTPDRIRVLEGDVCLPRFGLSERDYSEISECVTHIVHSAGNVRSNLPHDEALRIAVDSAAHVLELLRVGLRSGAMKKLDVVSTIGVGGRTLDPVREARIDSRREFHNSYEWAKAKAEELIYPAVDEGLPVTIHRPSMIVGATADGWILHFQVFYYICEFLSGVQTAGFLPKLGGAALDIVPVDYVARAVVLSSQSATTTGEILHLCSGPRESLPLRELTTRIRTAYKRHSRELPMSKYVPRPLYRSLIPLAAALSARSKRRRIQTLYFFLDYLAEEAQFENGRTRKLLEAAGLALPAPDAYVDRVLDYYLTRREAPND